MMHMHASIWPIAIVYNVIIYTIAYVCTHARLCVLIIFTHGKINTILALMIGGEMDDDEWF